MISATDILSLYAPITQSAIDSPSWKYNENTWCKIDPNQGANRNAFTDII